MGAATATDPHSTVGHAEGDDPPSSARRTALWRLGIAAPAYGTGDDGTQMALPLDLPEAPGLAPMADWDAMIADYATTGLTIHRHPMRLLRPGLEARRAVRSADLARLRHGTSVRIGGLVVARQRPGTANGVVFLLIEDEAGTVNLIVPPRIYERDRLTVRTEPLILVEGTLERHASAGGAINVLVQRLTPLDAADLCSERPAATVKDFSALDERERRRILEEQPLVAVAGGGGGGTPAAPAERGGALAAVAGAAGAVPSGGGDPAPEPSGGLAAVAGTVPGARAGGGGGASPRAQHGAPLAVVPRQSSRSKSNGRSGADGPPRTNDASPTDPRSGARRSAHDAGRAGGAGHGPTGGGPGRDSNPGGQPVMSAADGWGDADRLPAGDLEERQPPEHERLVREHVGAEDFRAVAPPVMSFTQGRRR
jgi:hypothetical protein